MHKHNRLFFFLGLSIVAVTIAFGVHYFFNREGRTIMNDGSAGDGLQLMSSAFKEGENIPEQYTCRGQNINPPLNIVGLPEGTKSLALILHDPDAVSGDFVHWTMWDIPAQTESIGANSVPVGAIQGVNGAGSNVYIGPCPPDGTGTHHYKFELYALDAPLSLPATTSRDELKKAMKDHIVDQTVLTGLFSAKK